VKKLLWFFCLLLLGSVIYWWARPPAPYLAVCGPVNRADGLGRQALELVEAFHLDFPCLLVPIDRDLSDVPSFMRVLRHKKNNRCSQGKVVVCQEPLVVSSKKLDPSLRSQQLRIAYAMCESTRLGQERVDNLNAQFDMVVVPDRFLIDVYRNSGVTLPIFELPLARNFQPFLQAPLKSERNSTFTVAALGSGIRRKNLPTLIRAFHKAFGTRSDVKLVLNCRTGTDSQIFEELARLKAPNIFFTTKVLDDSTYFDLLSRVDCYVNVSKAEGFSVQPREAMAMGIPTIVTDNTAQHTITESGLVRSIACPLEEVSFEGWNFPLVPVGTCFACREEDVVEALLDVERNYDFYLRKAEHARQWAAQYDFSNLKPLYKTLLKPNRIVLGKENSITADCLTTDSEPLFLKYQKVVFQDHE
jgi:glycosyltransferase involved in cell wall biosynthesis